MVFIELFDNWFVLRRVRETEGKTKVIVKSKEDTTFELNGKDMFGRSAVQCNCC